MTRRQAEDAGFRYTGMSSRRTDEIAKKKARAKEIKATFKDADYRIVYETVREAGGAGWVSIYGNDIFCRCQYFDAERAKANLESKDKAIADLKAKYEKDLAEIEDRYSKMEIEYNEMIALMK